jgi:hypothetical protein
LPLSEKARIEVYLLDGLEQESVLIVVFQVYHAE